MTTDLLLVQLLVLGATGVLFWLARRDLRSRANSAPPVQPDTQELEQLCVTLESLVTDLSRRLDRLEQRMVPVAAPPLDRGGVGAPLAAPSSPGLTIFPATEGAASSAPRGSSSAEAAPDARFAPIYALLDAGVSDPQEIARRVGLPRGEVDLILSLRDRRAL